MCVCVYFIYIKVKQIPKSVSNNMQSSETWLGNRPTKQHVCKSLQYYVGVGVVCIVYAYNTNCLLEHLKVY